MNARLRAVAAGAAGATVCGLQEPVDRRVFGCGEHVALYPLAFFVDRHHPARGQPGVPPLLTNGGAFGQATWRHALFGSLFGRLA